jgi:hypothetical protein
MSKELCKHTFFPFLKYSKLKDTKKIDTSKPPSIRAKVPYYDGKWNVEIYDTQSTMILPTECESITPVDLIPKMSNVACVLQCGGIWIGGKGWGLTWKLVQCVVKPRVSVSIAGKCQILLTEEDRNTIETQDIVEDNDDELVENATKVTTTEVVDSDDEGEPEPVAKTVAVVEPLVKATPEPLVKATPEPLVKATPEPEPAPVAKEEKAQEAVAAEAPAVVKKKVVKKKA